MKEEDTDNTSEQRVRANIFYFFNKTKTKGNKIAREN